MKLSINGVDLAYEVHGRTGPWVTLSHSLGCTKHMWEHQIATLSMNYRVLAYDLRGHGESTSDSTPGSLALLASDVLALLDHLDIARSHFIGISIGGMIGQTLAIEAPDRVASLVLANTTAYVSPLVVKMWAERIQQAKEVVSTDLRCPQWCDGFHKRSAMRSLALLRGLQKTLRRRRFKAISPAARQSWGSIRARRWPKFSALR